MEFTYSNPKKLFKLLNDASEVLKNEPSFHEIKTNKEIIFVGDTHGDFNATAEIFSRFSENLLVFLGDYVDRAEQPNGSLINITYLLEEKLKNPEKIILLRGNHEFRDVFDRYGFSNEIDSVYGKHDISHEIVSAFENVFSKLPYAAGTENGIIGLHGGIPDISSMNELKNLPKGQKCFESIETISQIVWNDNLYDARPTELHRSVRGLPMNLGFVYGNPYFSEKMNLLEKKVLLRGHDPYAKGFSLNDKILTIFTSKKYSHYGNIDGIFIVKTNPKKEITNAKNLEILTLNRK